MMAYGSRWLLVALALLLVYPVGSAQIRFTYSKGQSVSPAYEGWWQNEDGSHTMFFGYMNSNWEERLDVPVGPDNQIEPGGPDRGQPTHFYPRRNMFLFTVQVPEDFGDKELVWTLTTNGRTERAYGTLDPTTCSTPKHRHRDGCELWSRQGRMAVERAPVSEPRRGPA